MKFSDYLKLDNVILENRSIEKSGVALHLSHLEDLVIEQGKAGFTQFKTQTEGLLNFLMGLTSNVSLNLKVDGSPVIFFGPDPRKNFKNQFFIATKAAFSIGTPKINHTDEEIDQNYTGPLATLLKNALRELRKAYDNSGLIYQGDLLFSNPAEKTVQNIDGNQYLVFKPNMLVYAVPVDPQSELYNRVHNASVGIILHDSFKGQAAGDGNIIKVTPAGKKFNSIKEMGRQQNVFIEDSNYRSANIRVSSTSKTKIQKLLHQSIQVIQEIDDSFDEQWKTSPVLALLKTYINHLVRKGQKIDEKGLKPRFKAFLDKKYEFEGLTKTSEKQKLNLLAKRDRIFKFIDDNKFNLDRLLLVTYYMLLIKEEFLSLIDQLESKLGKNFYQTADGSYVAAKGEGFVSFIGNNQVKLVDRLDFTNKNFAKITKESHQQVIAEGGNAIKNVIPIPKANYSPTVNGIIQNVLNKAGIKYTLIGSAGKKDFSNDIDILISATGGLDEIASHVQQFLPSNSEVNANKGLSVISFGYPIAGLPGKNVQVDLMVSTSYEYSKFAYARDKPANNLINDIVQIALPNTIITKPDGAYQTRFYFAPKPGLGLGVKFFKNVKGKISKNGNYIDKKTITDPTKIMLYVFGPTATPEHIKSVESIKQFLNSGQATHITNITGFPNLTTPAFSKYTPDEIQRIFETLNESVLLENASVLYHVTSTSNMSKILAKGLMPMQTSNWVMAKTKERYGQGEIYAFDNRRDAIRWATKMDWDFNGGMGTEKIALITFRNEGEWEIDDASPWDYAGHEGNRYKQYIRVPPEDITAVELVGKKQLAEMQVRSESARIGKTRRIGIFAGGFKPPHAGHFAAAKQAAKENDEVRIIIGPKQRPPINAATSFAIWEVFARSLPNVIIEPVAEVTPVRSAYEMIDNFNKHHMSRRYELSVYADHDDMPQYSSVQKYANNLATEVHMIETSRSMSASAVREAILEGKWPKVASYMPKEVDVPQVLRLLKLAANT